MFVSLGGYLGLTIGWIEGIELNFMGGVLGFDIRRPLLKLPGLGRLGLPADNSRVADRTVTEHCAEASRGLALPRGNGDARAKTPITRTQIGLPAWRMLPPRCYPTSARRPRGIYAACWHTVSSRVDRDNREARGEAAD